MMKTTTLPIGHLTCSLATCTGSTRICYLLSPQPVDTPTVEAWAGHYHLHMAILTGLDWNNDLTPWPAPGLTTKDAPFGGKADALLRLLLDGVLPGVETAAGLSGPVRRMLTGVSLAGLFAVWTWMQEEAFEDVGSLSGSFWYDGFTDWLERQADSPHWRGCAYLSLGDREGRGGNPRYRTVQADTRRVAHALERHCRHVVCEPVKGTHFAPLAPRAERMLACLTAPADDKETGAAEG